MSAMFSIIIPVYNVAPYLRECLDSVLAQTCADWECICVDDGSTDGSAAILDEYAAKDLRFKVIHQANAGVSAARNAALDVVQGAYVWFVDGDDAIHPDALRWLDSVFKCHFDVDAYLFDRGYLDGTELPCSWPALADVSDVEVHTLRCSKIMQGFRRGVCGAVLKRASIPSRLRFDTNISVGEDVIFQLSCYWATSSWAYLEMPLYFYRTRLGSAINSAPTLKAVKDFLLTELKLHELLKLNRDKWTLSDNYAFFKWNRDFDWYTYRRMIFGLSPADRRCCIPLWCDVQRCQHEILSDTFYRRMVVRMLRMFPVLWLFDWLVSGDSLTAKIKAQLLRIRCVSIVNDIRKGRRG